MSTDDDSGFLSFYSLLLIPYWLSQTSELFGVLAGLRFAVRRQCKTKKFVQTLQLFILVDHHRAGGIRVPSAKS
jgi:hypothetical protein